MRTVSVLFQRVIDKVRTCAGHGEAVQHVKSFGRPMLVTGGGGYTKTNVARCWTNETATLLNQELDSKLPSTIFDEYFVSDPTLRLDARDGAAEEHSNKQSDLDVLKHRVLQNLEELRTAPAVQLHVRAPWSGASLVQC